MSLAELAQATFWGAVVIFALIAFYNWFIEGSFMVGLGAIGFMLFIGWLGIKIGGGK